LAGAVLNADVRANVIRLSAGAWYDPNNGKPGCLEIHGNPNVLTRDYGTSKVGQGPTSTTALVEIEKYLKPAPELTVNSAPSLAKI
jgi:biotin/methionine sulfoxide reductase